jgi:hypothetical protein
MHHVLPGLLLPFDLRHFYHCLDDTVLVLQLLLQLDKDLLRLFLCRTPLCLFSPMAFLVFNLPHLLCRLLPIFLLLLWLLLYHELPVLI